MQAYGRVHQSTGSDHATQSRRRRPALLSRPRPGRIRAIHLKHTSSTACASSMATRNSWKNADATGCFRGPRAQRLLARLNHPGCPSSPCRDLLLVHGQKEAGGNVGAPLLVPSVKQYTLGSHTTFEIYLHAYAKRERFRSPPGRNTASFVHTPPHTLILSPQLACGNGWPQPPFRQVWCRSDVRWVARTAAVARRPVCPRPPDHRNAMGRTTGRRENTGGAWQRVISLPLQDVVAMRRLPQWPDRKRGVVTVTHVVGDLRSHANLSGAKRGRICEKNIE